MKDAFKDYKIYVIGGILGLLGVGIPLGILGITLIPSLNVAPFDGYLYLMGAIMIFYFFVGFIWGDLKEASYRRKEKKWDDKLDETMKTTLWKRRLPFYLAGLIVLIVFAGFDIAWAITNSIPLI